MAVGREREEGGAGEMKRRRGQVMELKGQAADGGEKGGAETGVGREGKKGRCVKEQAARVPK
jgi:hypothetical protein